MSKKRVSYKLYLGRDPATGKRKYKSFTADTKREARRMADEYIANVKSGRTEPEKLTLGEAMDKYIADRDAIISPTTAAGYRKIKRNYFTKYAATEIGSITLPMLQSEINEMQKTPSSVTGKPLSPKTIREAYCFVTVVLKYFGVSLRFDRVTLPRREKIRYATPDTDTMRDILRAAYGTEIWIPVLLASWLSLRMSEIVGLRWDHVSPDAVTIDAAKVYAEGKTHDKKTKTLESERRIPIPRFIFDEIQKLPHDGEYVVTLSGQAIYKRFVRMLAANNIPHCRFHDLRHANASIMQMLDIPDKYAMQRGGWSSSRTYKNTYVQTFDSEELRVASVMDNFFENLLDFDQDATPNATITP